MEKPRKVRASFFHSNPYALGCQFPKRVCLLQKVQLFPFLMSKRPYYNQRGVSKAAGAGNSCESPVPYPLRVPEEQVLRRV